MSRSHFFKQAVCFLFVASVATQPSWVAAVEKVLSRNAPALERWTEIEGILRECRKCYKQVLRPAQVLVHPRNRAGLGLNGAQVHKTGAQVQSVGFSSMELRRSVCMEISTDPAISKEAFAFNERQVELNGGLLADVRGDERFMSLACSHFTAFCRACLAECPCAEQENVSQNGKLSVQRLSADFRAAVENGWEWLVLSAEVDARIPSLATFLQEVMNAAQGVARTASELELAMAMVSRAKTMEAQGLAVDWGNVQQEVAGCVPDAAPQTVAACALFSRFYAGGSSAPLLVFLHDFSLKYGASKRLGEEFMSTVSSLKFSGQERSHAMARAALIATNLTASRVVDGIARLLTKADIGKLSGKGMEDSVKQWEDLLTRAWTHTSKVTEGPARAKALECFGRLMVRTTLFMCKKERAGQEGMEHGSLAAILSLYEAEMGLSQSNLCAGVSSAPASCTGETMEAAAPASLEEMHDPVYLMKLQGIHVGKLYKGKQTYAETWPWRLTSIDKSEGRLVLEAPVAFAKKEKKAPLGDLKKVLEAYTGEPPELLAEDEVASRLPCEWEAFMSTELLRAEFLRLCCEHFSVKYGQGESCLRFCIRPTCLILDGKAKANKLNFFPFTDSISKIGTRPAAGSVEVWHIATGTSLFVSGPASNSHLLAGYWQISTGSEANLATVILNEKGWKVPILRNTQALNNCILYKAKATDNLTGAGREKPAAPASAASRKRGRQ